MRLSRWGWSPYETDADIQMEGQALSELIDVLPERADAEVVVVHSKIPFGAQEHKLAPSVRLLITTTSGTDHIDLAHFKHAGIRVARLPEARCHAVVDATLGMMIWGLRRMGPMHQAAQAGRWIRKDLPRLGPIGLRGSRIGVVGLGVIGQHVAQALAVLGAEVWGADPAGVGANIRETSIAEMMGHCDAVTLHCDLNPSTHGIIAGATLGAAHPELVLVNTARGPLLDVPLAVDMVRDGALAALALDVFPEEPWPHMSWAAELPSVMFLPHAAGYHSGLARDVREGLCRAVGAFLAGEVVPHLV